MLALIGGATALWFALDPLSGQLPLLGAGTTRSASQPVTLGVHAFTDNNTTTATTVAVALGTPTAGSTVVCAFKYPNASTFTSLADNVNAGVYQPAATLMREQNHNYRGGIFYRENVAASSTTVTLTYATTGTHAQMACVEVKGAATAYAFDSTFAATKALTGTNPTSGSTLTPFGNGRFLYGALLFDTGTTTAGANFTLLDQAGAVASAALYPEYWIQTTATATTTPYANVSSANYGVWTTAFAPSSAVGFCNATTVIDWSGGTNGVVPAASDLQLSTKGGLNQPNADSNLGSFVVGWVANSTGVTYSTLGYAPLVTTRTCPFYTGTGTGTLGVRRPTGDNIGGLAYQYYTTQNTVTTWTCLQADFSPTLNSGTADLITIGSIDGNDFLNLQMNSNLVLGSFLAELKSGAVSSPTVNWVANTWYGVRMTYVAGGTHSIAYYSFSGTQCTGTPTLMGTQSGASTGTNQANHTVIFGGGSNSYTVGNNFYMGAFVQDALYGAALAP
jgi:hypothetical protein